jgi:hypothetical protein
MVTVAIHQPNYLPWLGFFAKLRQSDVFVLLDDAQIQKTGSSWVNRTQILVAGRARWLTVPIARPQGVQLIRSVTIADSGGWSTSHRRMLHEAYRETSHYRILSPFLDRLFDYHRDSLLEFNIAAINAVLEILELSDSRKLVRASSLGVTSHGTMRLVELVKRAGGDSYLCGNGSSGYLEQGLFQEASVRLIWQNFSEQRRTQVRASTFVPGLSVMDSLLTIGPSDTRDLLGDTAN